MKIWKVLGVVFTILSLGLMPSTQTVEADGKVAVTIVNPKDYPDITYSIFKVADTEKLEDLQKESLDSLKQKYPQFEVTKASEVGQRKIELGLGLYYAVALRESDKQPVEEISPFLIQIADLSKDITIYPKVHELTGGIKLFKYEIKDGKKIPLAGVTFTLYDSHHQPVRVKSGQATLDADGVIELVTDEAGEITVQGLVAGTYYFKEIKGLPGYTLPKTTYPVTVEKKAIATIEVENERTDKGGARFRKVNPDQVGLPGAVFEVLDANKQFLFQVKSDENGYFEVTNLPYGTYYLREKEAPVLNGVHYVRLDQDIAFTITAESYTDGTIMNIVNKPVPPVPPTPNIPPFPTIVKTILPHTGEIVSGLTIVGLIGVAFVFLAKKKSRKDEKAQE
ncbi:SpaA isopeptide-forming pilin-related protein [Streptococcus pneumoniae]